MKMEAEIDPRQVKERNVCCCLTLGPPSSPGKAPYVSLLIPGSPHVPPPPSLPHFIGGVRKHLETSQLNSFLLEFENLEERGKEWSNWAVGKCREPMGELRMLP